MRPGNPQEKKELAYKKDRIGSNRSGQYRGSWKRKEKLEQRRERRVNRTTVRSESLRVTNDFVETDFNLQKKKKLKSWGNVALGEHVGNLGFQRISLLGRNFFKSNYDSTIHKVRFTRFLNGILLVPNKFEADIRLFFKKAMEPFASTGKHLDDPDVGDFNLCLRTIWLKEYFKEVPEMEQRIRWWIESET
jgi:hypothetical protein